MFGKKKICRSIYNFSHRVFSVIFSQELWKMSLPVTLLCPLPSGEERKVATYNKNN